MVGEYTNVDLGVILEGEDYGLKARIIDARSPEAGCISDRGEPPGYVHSCSN